MNLWTFILFGMDKRSAKHGEWRVPEFVLMGVSFFGGVIGGLCAMQVFRHKTQRPKFFIGLPLILFFHILLILLWWMR